MRRTVTCCAPSNLRLYSYVVVGQLEGYMDISGCRALSAPRDPNLLKRATPGRDPLERQRDDMYYLRLDVGLSPTVSSSG